MNNLALFAQRRRLAAALVAALLLASCGRQPDTASQTTPAAGTASAGATAGGAPMDSEKVLNVFNWSD